MPRKKKDPEMPKRPLSSYMFYSKERRPKLQEEQPNLVFGDYSKIIAEEWKVMGPEEKEPFLDLSKKDKDRYDEALKEYKEKKKNEPPPINFQDVEMHKNFTTQDHIDLHQQRQQFAKQQQIVGRHHNQQIPNDYYPPPQYMNPNPRVIVGRPHQQYFEMNPAYMQQYMPPQYQQVYRPSQQQFSGASNMSQQMNSVGQQQAMGAKRQDFPNGAMIPPRHPEPHQQMPYPYHFYGQSQFQPQHMAMPQMFAEQQQQFQGFDRAKLQQQQQFRSQQMQAHLMRGAERDMKESDKQNESHLGMGQDSLMGMGVNMGMVPQHQYEFNQEPAQDGSHEDGEDADHLNAALHLARGQMNVSDPWANWKNVQPGDHGRVCIISGQRAGCQGNYKEDDENGEPVVVLDATGEKVAVKFSDLKKSPN